MNKTEFKAQVMANRAVRVDSDWVAGSQWYRDNARNINNYFSNSNEDYNLPQLVASLDNLNMRDYLLGILDSNNPIHWQRLADLIKQTPARLNVPANTLMGLLYFEAGDSDTARIYLEKAKGYDLARLLTRVVNANWPTDSMKIMRSQLHNKVLAGIYGEMAVA